MILGIKNGYSAFLQEVSEEYHVTVQQAQIAQSNSSVGMEEAIPMVTPLFLIAFIASTFLGKVNTPKKKVVFLVFEAIIAICLCWILKNLWDVIKFWFLINLFVGAGRFWFLFGGRGGRFYGGGRRLFWRRKWWLFRRRRFFWRRWKHKRILKNNKNARKTEETRELVRMRRKKKRKEQTRVSL